MATILQNEEIRLPKVGEIVHGKIIGRKRSSVFVDLGALGSGIIFGREFYNAADILKRLNVGDAISAKVVSIDDEEGYVELSAKEAGDEMVWEEIKNKKESKAPVSVMINGANKGGLLAKIDGIPAFLPASQLGAAHYPHVEKGDKELILKELQKLIGKTLNVRILDIDQREQKLILSEKATENERIKDLIGFFKVGDIAEGSVSGIVNFGAFVKIDLPEEAQKNIAGESPTESETESGQKSEPEKSETESDQESEEQPQEEAPETLPSIEGLVHISELDWAIIEHPSEAVKMGDRVRAKIIDISPEGRLSLSIKALKKDPWDDLEKTYKKGDSIRGTVVKFNPFGAFVKIQSGVQGLVHISEFGSQKKMQEILEVGKEEEFKILLIEAKEHRMALGAIKNEEDQPSGADDSPSDPTDTKKADQPADENAG